MDRKYYTQNNSRQGSWFGLILIIFGLLFVTMVISLGVQNLGKGGGKIFTTATICDIQKDIVLNEGEYERVSTVYVVHSVNGEEVLAELSGYSSDYYVGKEIEIYYYPDELTIAHVTYGSLSFVIMASIIGTIIIVVGALLLPRYRKMSPYNGNSTTQRHSWRLRAKNKNSSINQNNDRTRAGKKRSKEGDWLFGLAFMIVGLLFATVGIYLVAQDMDKDDGRIYTTATIIEIQEDVNFRGDDFETDYTVFVVYSVDGEAVLAQLSDYASGYHEGKEIEIYYYLDDLTYVSIKRSPFMLIFPLFLGLIFVCVGALFLPRYRKKSTDNNNASVNQSHDKKARANKPSLALLICFTVGGLLFLGIGVYLIISECDIDGGNRVYTKAIVTEIEETTNNGYSIYNTRVSYEVDGEIVEAGFYGNAPMYSEGTEIRIYYYPESPQNPTIARATNTKNLLFPIVFSCFGLLISVMGMYGLIRMFAERKEEVVQDTGSDRTDDNGNAIGYASTIDYPFE